MNLGEYTQYDGLGLAELVRKGEVSPRELAQTALAAIEKVNPQINAVVEVYHERIESLDETQLGDGPFHGVPFFIKDVRGLEAGKKIEWDAKKMKIPSAPDAERFLRRDYRKGWKLG